MSLETDSITARYALSQGRDIYALPGKVGELNSLGPNQLIQNGAKMVTKASDIVMEYEFLYPNRLNIKSLPEFKPKIYFKKPKKIAPENQNLLFDDEGKNRDNWTGIAYDVQNIMEVLKNL